jgi:hypothetical protein
MLYFALSRKFWALTRKVNCAYIFMTALVPKGMAWTTIEHPGVLGKRRDEIVSKWNAEYGASWRLAYTWGSQVIERQEALQIYEDGYYEFFKSHPGELEWLLEKACDVYDTAPSNVDARFDYGVQETPSNHVHDVAIRRSILRLGTWFHGSDLIQIRSTSELGRHLSPARVPFHLPQLIATVEPVNYGSSRCWWDRYSIEDFYQRNKVLQINSS